MDGVQQWVFFVFVEAWWKVQPHLHIIALRTFEPVRFCCAQRDAIQELVVERLHSANCWQ